MNGTTSAADAEYPDPNVTIGRAAGCTHEATRLCHGALRWVCDDCGEVAEHSPAQRRIRLQGRLDALRQRGEGYNRRRDVA